MDEATIAQAIRLISPELIVLCVTIFVNRFRANYNSFLLSQKKLNLSKSLNVNMLDVEEEKNSLDVTDICIKKSTIAKKLTPNAHFKKHQHVLQNITTCATCGIAAIIYPCLYSLPYFIIFLILATFWSLNRDFRNQTWYRLRLCVLAINLLHIMTIYTYQLESIQQHIPPSTFQARLVCFTLLIIPYFFTITCYKKPKTFVTKFNQYF